MHAGGGKQTICWHCLKPLPRCSICLMHMGSEIGGVGSDDMTVDEMDGAEEESDEMGRKRSDIIKQPLAFAPGSKMTRIDAIK